MALKARLRERLIRHRGNADVVRLVAEKGVAVSRRTLQRACAEGRSAGDAVRDAPGPAATDRLRRTFGEIGRERSKHSCSWRRWGIRRGCMCVRSEARSKSTGSPGSRAHSRPLAACGGGPDGQSTRALVVRHDAVSGLVQFTTSSSSLRLVSLRLRAISCARES